VQASAANYRAEYQHACELSACSVTMARELGARRFEAESMVMHGLAQLGLGLTSEALATLEAGAARALESAPSYCAPWALASLAQALGPGARARELLANGEALLARGSVSHNHLEFRMLAIELYLGAHDWPAVAAQADALAEFTREEPLPWAELVIGRARALAEIADGPVAPRLRRRLRGLLDEAERMRFLALVPRLTAALG
jgi:hypothetical protein